MAGRVILPLNNIRVLDLTHGLAGPTATQILADLGAEVIKIERPGKGDIFRESALLGPSMFIPFNRNKRSVCIDLKRPMGRDLVLKLSSKCDVFVENLAPSSTKKLGLDYETIREINPRIVYCSITSFGSGPYEELPTFDPVIEAMSGFMSVTGFPPDKYVRAGVTFLDIMAGIIAVNGILAALLGREKYGVGSYVEVSLADIGLFTMSYWITYYKEFGRVPEPIGQGSLAFGAPSRLFKLKDGYLYVAALTDEHWERFCKALGFEDLARDARFRTAVDRAMRKSELEEELAKKLASMGVKETFEKLVKARVPAGPLYTVKEVFEDPHFSQRGLIKEHIYMGKIYYAPITPLKIGNKYVADQGTVPSLGEHTKDVLTELLGISGSELEILKKEGVIWYPPQP
jgi:crotonobetainyl-CoA:carnitine CoA-transferase CaiB-like acyl-CoA transferase